METYRTVVDAPQTTTMTITTLGNAEIEKASEGSKTEKAST
jgi:hypothetical protein